jgi:hypothetical protein
LRAQSVVLCDKAPAQAVLEMKGEPDRVDCCQGVPHQEGRALRCRSRAGREQHGTRWSWQRPLRRLRLLYFRPLEGPTAEAAAAGPGVVVALCRRGVVLANGGRRRPKSTAERIGRCCPQPTTKRHCRPSNASAAVQRNSTVASPNKREGDFSVRWPEENGA